MKERREVDTIISGENFAGKGIEKNIYRDPKNTEAFAGLFRNTRKVVFEGESVDALRPFQETPNYIKAIFYVNQLAEMLMPGRIRHVEQAGRIPPENGDDSVHIFYSRGFIEPGEYKAVDLKDEVHQREKMRFAENGFHYDDKFSNLAIRDGKDGVVYTDTVSPWRYQLRGVIYEHSRNGKGTGGFEYVYEPIPLFDYSKIEAAIQHLGDSKEKAEAYLSRLRVLLEEEKRHWAGKRKIYSNADSLWEAVNPEIQAA